MKCPFCKSLDTKVVDTRPAENDRSVRRRRECLDCHRRFTTYERYETNSVMVVKRDTSRELLDPKKILRGMQRSCDKRKVSMEELESAVKEIEFEINHMNVKEIESYQIGEMIMKKLLEIDEVAYIRFASVYRRFDDIDSFNEEIERIKREKNNKE